MPDNAMPDRIEKVPIQLKVNGKSYSRTVEPRKLLVELLREDLDLTGTHVGCDTTYCGACTVLMNGAAVKSCTMFAVQADGTEILTVEGLEKERRASPHPKSLWRLLRIAMRVLYAGAHALCFTVIVPEPATERKRNAQGDCGKHLPLYRISEYSEGNS
jgi:hypothetical protein